jgi:phosphoserine phosphatase RsbU/P
MTVSETDAVKVKRNLAALVEYSRIINSSLELNFILNNLLFTCMGKFFSTKGFIALEEEGILKIRASKAVKEDLLNNFPVISSTNFNEDVFFKDYRVLTGIATVEEIRSSEKCIGIICLGEKLNKSAYSEDDIEFLRTILNISATAIQNSLVIEELKLVNRELDSRINRLSSLFELSKEFGLISESSRVAKLLIYSVIGQFLVSKFAVITFEEESYNILENKFAEAELFKITKKYDLRKIEISFIKEKIEKNYPELRNLGIELIVPMQLQGETKGLIFLGKRINNQQFQNTDIEFIYSVGSLAIISLENKRLFKEALEKQKMEEELEIAREIQRNLLPRSIPDKFNNFDIAAVNISSKQVGGDYYDFISLDENNFCVAIADVSGKGVPASLLVANIQAFLKVICKQGMKLNEATTLINDLITENITDGKFITFFWGLLENDSRKMVYVNAGHNPPLVIRDNNIIKLKTGGMLLGVMKTFIPYQSEEIQLLPNDLIVLFTDGISEALSKEGEEFSDEKLEEIATNRAGNSAAEILKNIIDEVQKFSAGTVQSDDITLMIIKVK